MVGGMDGVHGSTAVVRSLRRDGGRARRSTLVMRRHWMTHSGLVRSRGALWVGMWGVDQLVQGRLCGLLRIVALVSRLYRCGGLLVVVD